jgi:hypothetical protein
MRLQPMNWSKTVTETFPAFGPPEQGRSRYAALCVFWFPLTAFDILVALRDKSFRPYTFCTV